MNFVMCCVVNLYYTRLTVHLPSHNLNCRLLVKCSLVQMKTHCMIVILVIVDFWPIARRLICLWIFWFHFQISGGPSKSLVGYDIFFWVWGPRLEVGDRDLWVPILDAFIWMIAWAREISTLSSSKHAAFLPSLLCNYLVCFYRMLFWFCFLVFRTDNF